ncbi:MAG: isochorismate synthase, partial [Ignavibacteriaceae bacterium]
MKFMVEHSDEEWKEFNDSDWFVPEFVFIKLKNECSIIYNFLRSANQKNEKIIERFKLKLENIFNLINSEKENCNSFKILNESGTSPKDKKKWKQNVQSALEEIQNKIIDKIVLSRKVEFILSEKPSVENFIEQLKVKFPRCYIFIVHCRESTFIGATPEKLANFENGNVELDALAGSAPRGKNVDEDNSLEKDLLANKKNLNEHNFVVNHIKDIISKHNYEDLNTTEITVRKLANIQHLLTKFSVKLNHDSSIFSILKELSPTPAVCGIPLQSSMQLIKKLESHKRGLYSGFIGWLNFENEGEFAVSIRSALINNKKIIAYAGSGIVEDSDPELEFNETDLKLNTILNLLRNENKN